MKHISLIAKIPNEGMAVVTNTKSKSLNKLLSEAYPEVLNFLKDETSMSN